MIYLADLKHDGLIKVGITHERRADRRATELRKRLREAKLEIFDVATVPFGWGSDRSWQRELLQRLKMKSGRLQLFAKNHMSGEVVEIAPSEASLELQLMVRRTEVDINLRGDQLNPERVDWRFEAFMRNQYPKTSRSHCDWRDPILRQVFLWWLRGEPIIRSIRLAEGYSCDEMRCCLT